MKLGEMLVRDGRITPAQLEQALAHQTRVGGRIGSILVELGFLERSDGHIRLRHHR